MNPDVNPLYPVPAAWHRLAERSRQLLRRSQHSGGAWPASPHFAPYQFCWFRDGSFIAEGASAAGLVGEADRFHRWCAQVLLREEPAVDAVVAALGRGEPVADDEYLPARYNLDGSRHVDDWWNFQVDGYGTWLWALERHLDRTGQHPTDFAPAIEVAVRYLVATGRGTCRDWWEENRDETHVATLAGVVGGLRSAVRMGTPPTGLAEAATAVSEAALADVMRDGVEDGRLVKWLGGSDVDASLLPVAALYDALPVDHPVVTATVAEIESRLTTPTNGVHRYESDTFYGGGQWPVLGCLLAWHHIRLGNLDRAAQLLDWVASTADADRLLPEQAPPLLAPDRLAEWDGRWGQSADPLLWSHGMFLATTTLLAGRRSD